MYKVLNHSNFITDLINMRKMKSITFYYDIETYQYNENKGYEKPSLFKNRTYSLAIGYFLNDTLNIVTFVSFRNMFDIIFKTYKGYKTNPTFQLIAHNCNKYDNHYLREELIRAYKIPFVNLFLKTGNDEGNRYTKKIKEVTKEEKFNGIILEKRVKSRNNLELVIYKNNIKFYTVDNYLKTNASIKVLGKKLLKLGKITENELKTDYNYTKYNVENDMTDIESELYAEEIYNQLSEDEMKYIYNDIIILAYSVVYYSEIFKGFDYSKITFTSNILESYNINDLTSFQLLKKIGQGKNSLPILYTDYKFNNQNFYDYLKSFYNGGLNFYNEKYLGEILKFKVFGMDINSSYPYAMHSKKIPTFLKYYEEYEKETKVNIKAIEKQRDTFTLYRISQANFDKNILNKIESRVIKQLLIKYYSKSETININSYTLKLIKDITGIKIDTLEVYSFITFDCVYFGANNILEDYYRIKTQGQNSKKLNMDSLYNIYETEEESDTLYSEEEINISKLNLNGLYGIPALRPYFNLFRWQGGQLNNVENGFMNSQRNVLFSVFVTSVSLYNLLIPMRYLTQKEIDNNFLYCDTDSLYWNKRIVHKFPKDIFDTNNLGAWDIQNDEIDMFFIMNHKKYAYLENGKINVKAGGIPQDSFNLDMSFEDFISTQFSDGIIIKNKKSIYNEQETISIYDSETQLEIGKEYRNKAFDINYNFKKKFILESCKEMLKGEEDTGLYIESNIGTFSISEVFPVSHETKNKQDLSYYKLKEDYIKDEWLKY